MKKFLILFLLNGILADNPRQKNVIIIMADDLGYDDVSFRGSNEIPTPNIDALAYNSVILNRFYTPPLCSPSRSSLMTGQYPHSIGMQELVVVQNEPWGLPLEEKILPEYLKDVGYKTAMIGKWHLGFFKKSYIPTERGFDNFFGYIGGVVDYFDYSMQHQNYTYGYDLRRNEEVVEEFRHPPHTKYATELFTEEAVNIIENHADTSPSQPLFMLVSHLSAHAANDKAPMQAPEEEIAKFSYIQDPKRRILAAMISYLDKNVGEIVASLARKKMLNDTVIFFYSDNGGPTIGLFNTHASNFPLRSQKQSPWEGAIRTNGFVFSSDFNPGVRHQLFHVSDILPTVAKIAGFKIDKKIDGINQYEMLKSGAEQPRKEIITLDDVARYGSVIKNNFKFVNGTTYNGMFDGWLSIRDPKPDVTDIMYSHKVLSSIAHNALNDSGILLYDCPKMYEVRKLASVSCPITGGNSCNPLEEPCLFDLEEDPCERNNLAKIHPEVLESLKEIYLNAVANAVPSRRKPGETASDPSHFNNTWHWWQGEL